MTKLTITITRAGLERFTAAQLDDDLDLSIAAVGLSDAEFVASPTLEALPGEFRRIEAVSGKQVGDNIVHMTLRDEAEVGYSARGFGLFLLDGTLFAVYSQPERLFEKSPRATFLAAIDIAFPTGDVSELRFGNTDFLNPPATTSTKGVVELATEAEVDDGVMGPLAVTAALLRRAVLALQNYADGVVADLAAAVIDAMDGLAARTIYGAGLVTGGGRNDINRTLTVAAASSEEVRVGAIGSKAVTPKSLAEARMLYVADSGEGFRLLSDGTMEQWGFHPVAPTEGNFRLNFPRPFATECLGVFTTVRNNAGSVDGQTTIQEREIYADHADLFVQNHQTATNDAAGFRWRAWGR